MSGLVVVGSANLDRFCEVPALPAAGRTIAATAARTAPGGKGANQAVAAARLEARVRFVGAVGSDDAGARLRDELGREGIATDRLAARGDEQTGEAYIFVDPAAENTIVVVAGANATLGPEDVPPEALAEAGALTLSFEIPLETVAHAARLAKEAGVPVILNPSPFRAIPPALLADAEVLVVNEHELRQLTGEPLPDGAAIERALGGLAVPRAVVTLGAEGAVSRDERGELRRHAAPAVAAVDTTGCGDAFLGGLAAGLLDGLGFAEAVDRAVLVGALTATRPGAQPSYPTREELAQWRHP